MEPQRTCIGCRRRDDKSALIRLALQPSTALVAIDRAQRASGRGCYVHADCAATAVQRRAVGRALRASVDPAQVAAILAELTGRA